jgi:CheY-like chemotaxis protein
VSIFNELSISLLLTDIMMPKMNGFELANAARRIRPELPVIFVPAFCNTIPSSLQDCACVEKPFKPSELLQRVTRALTK